MSDLQAYNQGLWQAVDKVAQLQLESGQATALDLRAWRQSLGFSLAEMGSLIGCHKWFVSQIETGREPMTPNVASRLQQLAERMRDGLFDQIPSRGRFPQLVVAKKIYVQTERIRARAGSYRKCLQCPRNFYATSTRQKYCSNKCKNDHARKWKGKVDPADQKPRARRTDPSAAAVRCPGCGHVFRAKGNVVFLSPHAGDGGGAAEQLASLEPDPGSDPVPGVARPAA